MFPSLFTLTTPSFGFQLGKEFTLSLDHLSRMILERYYFFFFFGKKLNPICFINKKNAIVPRQRQAHRLCEICDT